MEVQKGASIDDGSAHGAVKVAPLALKLRQGMSTAKKGRPCTPVPAWKLEDSADFEALREDLPAAVVEPKRSSVSARKLGAELWEIQDLTPECMSGHKGSKIGRRRDSGKAVDSDAGEDWPQSAGSLRRHAVASLIKQQKLNEASVRALKPVSPASYTSSMEIAALDQAITPSSSKDPRGKYGEVGYSLKTSTELLKVLNRIWSLEEKNAANVSLVKALKVELEHARGRIQELMQEKHEYRHDIDNLVKQVAEDKRMRKSKEQQKIKAAVLSIKEELEDERHLRRQSENLHRRLGKELSEVKTAFLKAVKDLEGQRKANRLLEDLCDEFAEGIRGYEQEVRDLRQKTSGDCYEKGDQSIVHISETWLDQRIQLKIAEAQHDLAERTSVMARLRYEIETFLQTRKSRVSKLDTACQTQLKREHNLPRQSLESVHLNGATSAPCDAEDDDSVASDLHCFELNVGAGKNEKHDGIEQNDQKEFGNLYSTSKETLDATKKSKFPLKKPTYFDETDQDFSTLHSQYFGCAESVGIDAQHYEKKMQQMSDCYHTQENAQEMKLKSHMQVINCTNDQAIGSCSEITECCKDENDIASIAMPHDHFSWRDQLASVGEDDSPVEFRHTASPVQKWKYQYGHPDSEQSQSASRLARGIKETTLKAKLLEARREGRHARLKASKGSFVDAIRQ